MRDGIPPTARRASSAAVSSCCSWINRSRSGSIVYHISTGRPSVRPRARHMSPGACSGGTARRGSKFGVRGRAIRLSPQLGRDLARVRRQAGRAAAGAARAGCARSGNHVANLWDRTLFRRRARAKKSPAIGAGHRKATRSRDRPGDRPGRTPRVVSARRVAVVKACRVRDHVDSVVWWAHQDSNLGQTGYEPAALTAELWARSRITSHSWPPIHPVWRRSSSVKYCLDAPSSRLASRTPRRPKMQPYPRPGPRARSHSILPKPGAAAPTYPP